MLENWKHALKLRCMHNELNVKCFASQHRCGWVWRYINAWRIITVPEDAVKRKRTRLIQVHLLISNQLISHLNGNCVFVPIQKLFHFWLSEDWVVGHSCSARPLKLLKPLSKWICLCCSFCESLGRLSETLSGRYCVIFSRMKLLSERNDLCVFPSIWSMLLTQQTIDHLYRSTVCVHNNICLTAAEYMFNAYVNFLYACYTCYIYQKVHYTTIYRIL